VAVQLLVASEDLLRCRFALSPLWETVAAVRTLADPRRQAYHLPWWRQVRLRVDTAGMAPLFALLPRSGYTPDFLTPPPPGPLIDIDSELERVAATPIEQVTAELERSLNGPERDVTPLPPGLAAHLRSDPARTLAELTEILRRCWEQLIAAQWPQLRDLLEADIAARSRQLAAGGLHRLLTDLHTSIQWHEGAIHIAGPHQITQTLGGQGLLLLPSAFIWPALTLLIQPPWQPTLIYPARGIAELWNPAPTPSPQALQRLIGRTRSHLLTNLNEPTSTSALARTHTLSPATVSGHLIALRDAGLITSHRAGRIVYYQRTALGIALSAATLTQPNWDNQA
jgi:DNA-binding MarR family transcriptional regulator